MTMVLVADNSLMFKGVSLNKKVVRIQRAGEKETKDKDGKVIITEETFEDRGER